MSQFKTQLATTDTHLNGILALQQANLPKAISTQESQAEGFVTVEHTFDLLKKMNDACAHCIALSDNEVAGYALTMLPSFGQEIPILIPMFEKINTLSFRGQALRSTKYVVMGQVCIGKAFRRQGLFRALYDKMKEAMAQEYEAIVTEIATKNVRSMQAHAAVGFEVIDIYEAETEEWAIVALSIS